MPTLVVFTHDGNQYQVHAQDGESAMKAVINSDIPGMLADCGGHCNCATCHAYVDTAWIDRLPSPKTEEQEMIDCAIEPRENSRLACQLIMSSDLDGLVIHLPESQI